MEPARPRSLALVGPGRAGSVVTAALAQRGWHVAAVAGRATDAPSVVTAAARFSAPARAVVDAVRDVDLVVLGVPDRSVPDVAAIVADGIRSDALVVHLAGSLGVAVLDRVPARRGALHPLMTFAAPTDDPEVLAGAGAAVAGDTEVADLARVVGLVPFPLADEARAAYHAAAVIASNHLVALLAQVDACTEVPVQAFLPLMRTTLDNVGTRGVHDALTGPVQRGDTETVIRHLVAIPEPERAAYRALAERAARVAGRSEEFAAVLR